MLLVESETKEETRGDVYDHLSSDVNRRAKVPTESTALHQLVLM